MTEELMTPVEASTHQLLKQQMVPSPGSGKLQLEFQ